MKGPGHCVSGVLYISLCSLMIASGLSDTKRDDPDDVNLLNYQVTKISQQRTENGYNVQIYLNGSYIPQVYVQNISLINQPYFYGMPSSDGLVEFHTATGYAAALFTHPRGLQLVSLWLHEDRDMELVIPRVELFSQNGRDITFASGENATVNITLRQSDSSRSIRFEYMMAVKNKTESNTFNPYHDRNSFPFELLDRGDNGVEKYAHLRLLTSSGEVEGILGIGAVMEFCRYDSINPCIHGGYAIVEGLPVYQNDHAGPFPDHYIGHVSFEPPEHEREGPPGTQYCPVHRPCVLVCMFVGDRLTPVEFTRVAGDTTPSGQISLANNGLLAVGLMEFTNITGGSEVEYQCKTTSGPVELRYTTKMIFIHVARINYDRTGATTLDNGTADVTCWAEGTPAPSITFHRDYYGSLSAVLDSSSYHITRTQVSNTTSKAVLRIYDPAVVSKLDYVVCRATNYAAGMEREDSAYINL